MSALPPGKGSRRFISPGPDKDDALLIFKADLNLLAYGRSAEPTYTAEQLMPLWQQFLFQTAF